MVHDSIRWNISNEKCFEIIHNTLIDILNEEKLKILPLSQLIERLNLRTRIHRLHNNKRYNKFSKYLKHKHGGILKFIQYYNFYEIIKTDKNIQIKLHNNLVEKISENNKRITKDDDWIMIGL